MEEAEDGAGLLDDVEELALRRWISHATS